MKVAARIRDGRLRIGVGDNFLCIQGRIVSTAVLEDLEVVVQEIAVGGGITPRIEYTSGKFYNFLP